MISSLCVPYFMRDTVWSLNKKTYTDKQSQLLRIQFNIQWKYVKISANIFRKSTLEDLMTYIRFFCYWMTDRQCATKVMWHKNDEIN